MYVRNLKHVLLAKRLQIEKKKKASLVQGIEYHEG